MPKLVQSNPDNNIVLQKDDIVNTYNTQNSEKDAEYLTAVETGDMETAQAMINEAAKAWGAITDEDGNAKTMYHGTLRGGFNVFGKKDYW